MIEFLLRLLSGYMGGTGWSSGDGSPGPTAHTV